MTQLAHMRGENRDNSTHTGKRIETPPHVRIITNVSCYYYDREQFIRRSNLQEALL
jgi:hypothetical protein